VSEALSAPPWPVLVVDDDRGVLEVTRMALERVRVDGRQLALEVAESAAAARVLLAAREYAVAIVDVVMETDRAGLDLVREMRDDARHALTQIVVRTGEPGAYPEAKVIEDFRISDYWPKVELRAARMRASVTGLVRSYATARSLDRELREKELLLREVHHRVKNNLQILSSLLALQGAEVDAATRARLEQAAGRVRSMALVHEQLYGGTSLAEIDLHAYLTLLARDLGAVVGDSVDVGVSGEAVALGIDVAIPVGLIVNELLTNAVKHGRSEDGRARVRIVLARREGGVAVTVSDAGAGLPAGAAASGGLGSHLVQVLCRQLRGSVSQRSEGGLHVTVELPIGSGFGADAAASPAAS
jgi:two-component sensor histidine kinase/CheY-like chemotaxis protein